MTTDAMQSAEDVPAGGDRSDRGRALPVSLSARQRRLHERLVDFARVSEVDLGSIYVGVIETAGSTNPDRCALAAHGCRELIEKLIRVGQDEPEEHLGNPRDRGNELADAWERYVSLNHVSTAALLNERVDGRLVRVLLRVERYVESARAHKPSRARQVARAVGPLGIVDLELPETLRKTDEQAVRRLWEIFIHASHHRSECRPEVVDPAITDLEDLLMRMVPATFADLDEIDDILGGGNG